MITYVCDGTKIRGIHFSAKCNADWSDLDWFYHSAYWIYGEHSHKLLSTECNTSRWHSIFVPGRMKSKEIFSEVTTRWRKLTAEDSLLRTLLLPDRTNSVIWSSSIGVNWILWYYWSFRTWGDGRMSLLYTRQRTDHSLMTMEVLVELRNSVISASLSLVSPSVALLLPCTNK